MDMKMMIQSLRLGNPKVFDRVVGFQVETFYESGKNTILWEKPAMLGRTKTINTDKLMKLCFVEMQKIQDANKIMTFESFSRLAILVFDTKADLEILFYEMANSANVKHDGMIYEYLVDGFIEYIGLCNGEEDEKEVLLSTYKKLQVSVEPA